MKLRLKAGGSAYPTAGANGVTERASKPARVTGRWSSRSSALLELLDRVHSSGVWRRRLGMAPGMWLGGVEEWENLVRSSHSKPGARRLVLRGEFAEEQGRGGRGGTRILPEAVCFARGIHRVGQCCFSRLLISDPPAVRFTIQRQHAHFFLSKSVARPSPGLSLVLCCKGFLPE